jgi:hypothetical protein
MLTTHAILRGRRAAARSSGGGRRIGAPPRAAALQQRARARGARRPPHARPNAVLARRLTIVASAAPPSCTARSPWRQRFADATRSAPRDECRRYGRANRASTPRRSVRQWKARGGAAGERRAHGPDAACRPAPGASPAHAEATRQRGLREASHCLWGSEMLPAPRPSCPPDPPTPRPRPRSPPLPWPGPLRQHRRIQGSITASRRAPWRTGGGAAAARAPHGRACLGAPRPRPGAAGGLPRPWAAGSPGALRGAAAGGRPPKARPV